MRENLSAAERLLAKQLRVREKLPLRELAERAGLDRNGCTQAISNLVAKGMAVHHPGSTRRGDRAARYSKPSKGQAA